MYWFNKTRLNINFNPILLLYQDKCVKISSKIYCTLYKLKLSVHFIIFTDCQLQKKKKIRFYNMKSLPVCFIMFTKYDC